MNPSFSLYPYQKLNGYFVDLHTFSHLPARTFVHKDRSNHFIPTGGSTFWGGQTVANLAKGHNSAQLANDLSNFAESLGQTLQQSLQQAKISHDSAFRSKIFRQFVLINRQIDHAIVGESNEGGLKGLLTTYEEIQPSLQESIEKMKKDACEALEGIYDLLKKEENFPPDLCGIIGEEKSSSALPYCPEEFFTDEEWEQTIETCSSLRAECVGLLKYATYSFTLKINETLNAVNHYTALAAHLLGIDWQEHWHWWDKILTLDNGSSLYLGALPLIKEAFGFTYRNDLEDLKSEKITAILTVVEVFENISQGAMTSPITPVQWKEAGIKQIQIATPDFHTIPLDLILRGIEFIHWNLKNGRSTYVHCKAGHGRSFLMIMCYLMKYHDFSSEQAFILLQTQRPHAGFSAQDSKMKTALEFERLLKNQK